MAVRIGFGFCQVAIDFGIIDNRVLEDRIHLLASVIAIDVFAYAVMSNHTHLGLHINKAKSLAWSHAEENCTGKFWEGRLKSQALLDEKALIACMAYIDLNPVRAKMAPTPEDSIHTSVKFRCDTLRKNTSQINPNILFPLFATQENLCPKDCPFILKTI